MFETVSLQAFWKLGFGSVVKNMCCDNLSFWKLQVTIIVFDIGVLHSENHSLRSAQTL